MSSTFIPSGKRQETPLWIALLPLVLGQIFSVWTVSRGTLTYFECQLLTAIEVWLVALSLVFFNSRTPLKKRLETFATLSFVFPFLLLFVVMTVTLAIALDGGKHVPLSMFVDAFKEVNQDTLSWGAAYIMLTLGVSVLLAIWSNTPSQWWYLHVFAPSQAVSAAFLLGIFMTAPIIIARQQIPWLGELTPHTMNVVLMVCFAIVRGFLAIRIEKMQRQGQFKTPYSEFD